MNSGLPALFGVKANTGKAFESEREILYQVLFDMRRDVTDLKKLVNTLMAERGAQSVRRHQLLRQFLIIRNRNGI